MYICIILDVRVRARALLPSERIIRAKEHSVADPRISTLRGAIMSLMKDTLGSERGREWEEKRERERARERIY